ncbi:MAG: hypothetical protein M0P94_00665 [Candidatus Absconditabacterales bacterium]|nr:hypothetical protein [Candidatus Absconditabacterales bacterium]
MEILKKSILALIFLAVISYLVYLITFGVVIVNENFLDQNKIIIGLYILIFLYYLFFYVIKPTYIKKFKLRNTLIGVFIIVSSQSFFLNSGHEGLYFADIFTVIGLFLTIIGPTNLLISKKLKQEKQEKKMEIIEV